MKPPWGREWGETIYLWGILKVTPLSHDFVVTAPPVGEPRLASPTGGAGAQWAPSCADRAGRRDGGPAKPGRKGLLSERFPPPCFLRWKGEADSPPSTRAARQVVIARFCGGSRSARIVPPGPQSSFLAALSRPCSRRAGTGLWEARALKTPAPRRKSSLGSFLSRKLRPWHTGTV